MANGTITKGLEKNVRFNTDDLLTKLATKEYLESRLAHHEDRLTGKIREVALLSVGLNYAGLVVILSLFNFLE